MPNKPDPNNIVWDESAIEWDKPSPPEQQKQQQAGFDFDLALKNLGTGAWGKLKDLVNPETYINLTQFAATAGQDPIGTAKLIANDFANKYGSLEKAKTTFQNTPIEPVLDASMILTGGGTAAAKLPGWLGKVGKTAQTVGMATDPFNVAVAPVKTLGWFASPGARKVHEHLMASAAKIRQGTSDLSIEEIRRAARRALDDDLWVSERKLNELKGKMDAVRTEINSGIDIATQRGDFVDMWRVADEIDKIKDLYGKEIIPIPNLQNKLDDLKQLMFDVHGERVTPKVAQEMKMFSQRVLDNAYGDLSAMAKEAKKYATKSVREQLEEIHPPLKTLNPKMQEYVWLKNGIEKVVDKMMEQPIVEGLSFYNAVVRRTIDHPIIKSRIASILNKVEKKSHRYSPFTTLGREATYKGAAIFTNPKEQRIAIEE